MASIRTELDPRFSDTGAEPTPWDQTRRALEAAGIFWISTVRRDGRPHVTPLVAVWSGEALHLCTGPSEQKALNLAHRPQVVLTTGCNDWGRGLDVVVEGTAERVADPARLAELAAAWRDKWDGRWRFEPTAEGFRHEGGEGIAHVFAVRPEKVLAFGKNPFTHTRHVFGAG